MPKQSASKQDRTAALTPPGARWRVRSLDHLGAYRLRVQFNDGLEGIVDLGALVSAPSAGVFAALVDPAVFAKAYLDFGVVTWPGDIDLAPDAMYREIAATGHWRIKPA